MSETGTVYIQASLSNTIIIIVDESGKFIATENCNQSDLPRRNLDVLSAKAATAVAREAIRQGIRSVKVSITGTGKGREPAISALKAQGLKINGIRDVTPLPHNGCTPLKKRRL